MWGERSKIKYGLEQKRKKTRRQNLMNEEVYGTHTVNIITVDTSPNKCT